MLCKPRGTFYLRQRSFSCISVSQDFQKQTQCSPRSFSVKYHSQNELWSLSKKLAADLLKVSACLILSGGLTDMMPDALSDPHDWGPVEEAFVFFLLATHAIALDLCISYLSRRQCPWNLCVLDRTDGAQPISKCVPKMTSSLGTDNSWDPVNRDSSESSTSGAMSGKMPPHGTESCPKIYFVIPSKT